MQILRKSDVVHLAAAADDRRFDAERARGGDGDVDVVIAHRTRRCRLREGVHGVERHLPGGGLRGRVEEDL